MGKKIGWYLQMESLTQVKVKHRVFEDAVHLTIPPGASIREIVTLAQIPEAAMPNIVVLNHGSVVGDWEYITKDADNLAICVVPQGGGRGGKGILGAVAMIAIAAFAWYATPVLFGLAAGSGVTGFAMSAVAAGITMVGSMAMNALIKPPSVDIGKISSGGGGYGGVSTASTARQGVSDLSDVVEAQTYSFGGQSNQARKYSPAVKVYGRHRLFPALVVNPFIDNAGTQATITSIYDFGLGNVQVEDMRIGASDVNIYQPTLEFHSDSLMKSTNLYSRRVAYDSLSYVLKQNDEVILSTKPNTISAAVDIYFPRGLVFLDDRGKRHISRVQLEVWWREVGNPTWNKVQESQFFGATVRQDVAINRHVEQYGTSSTSVVESEQFSEHANRTLWAITHYPQADGSIYEESTIYWGGSLVYGGPNVGLNGKYQEWTIGAQQKINDYLPTSKEYLFAVTRNRQQAGGGGGGETYWVDIEDKSPTYAGTYTQVFVGGNLVYNSYYLNNGVTGDYIKGSFKETRVESSMLTRHYYSVMVPEYTPQVTSTVAMSTVQPFTVVATVDFGKEGNYEFKVIRRSPVSQESRRADDTTLTLIKSFQAGDIFRLNKKHTMLEMRLVATDKISQVVSNLSAICTSVLPTYDGTNWLTKPTRNPAWIVYDILTGEANPSALKPEQIDLPSFYRLAQMCDEVVNTTVDGVTTAGPRYTSDFVVDYETTVYQLIESVLSVCRSTLIMTQSGKYGILIDKAQTVPRQLFTPANSWGFSGNRSYSDRPNAIRVKYVEPNMDWQMNEIVVYDDGYTKDTATKFEELSTFGITYGGNAWRYGRYMLAQGLHRSEQFTISVDVENLAVQRGDLVAVAHDVPKIGGVGARVVSVKGSQIEVDQFVQVNLTNFTVRTNSGIVRSGKIVNMVDDHTVTVDDAYGIDTDSLIVFGNVERVTQNYLVHQITPGADLTADLMLVRYVPGVYTADEGDIPPWESGLTEAIINKSDLELKNLTGTAKLVYPDRMPFSEVSLAFNVTGYKFSHVDVYLIRKGHRDLFLGMTRSTVEFKHLIDTINEPDKLGDMLFEVIPVSTRGFWGKSAQVTVHVFADTTPPEMPYGFSVNVQKEQVKMFWQPSAEEDLSHYILRYTPEVLKPNWDASQFLARTGWQTTSTTAGARTGTYMIKAVDTSGNMSPPAMQRTTVATLPDINFIEDVNDVNTGWNGKHYLTMNKGSKLQSQGKDNDVVPESYYICKEVVDLGEVYEARISSKIRGYGQHWDDFMSNWVRLSDVPRLARAQSDQWDAWVDVRTIDKITFMSAWTKLSLVDPIAGGTAKWSEWRAVQVGDFTAQLFQFRIQLRSLNNLVRPIVTDGLIEVDMPDRLDSDSDIVIPVGGSTIVFNPAFRATPALAVSIDGNDKPVVAKVTNKDRDSFDIQLIDTLTNNPVAGKIDWTAKGYGRKRSASI
jgi:hypothetical protein